MSNPFASYSEMSEEAGRYIRELETWFEDHGRQSKKPWPVHLIESKERRLAWVLKSKEIFDRGSKRDGEAA